MVEAALRGVVREALARTAAKGLPGAHHFYITFRTHFQGLTLPDYLARQYPDEMTVVLEHQFWDLEVAEDRFAVTLSFQNKPERLVIPFEAITAFADPAVKFGLQFQATLGEAEAAPGPAPAPAEAKAEKPGEVVALDAFRKK
ncbi:MAG TPA: ClpXP protease specificity-enhancing factor SspB [Stellaceae bacterium]|jgi:hypothetical protein|nr:ClpXP protease specificity-enhancing factor SspB [Stellaceae bacterium]